mmetsp:Transcript_16152/g.55051  ORF Transcript_16152/g.55051 Transcript_16152/m.55051 type:complete len:266 (+) Transcript_16152:835-1632(+)
MRWAAQRGRWWLSSGRSAPLRTASKAGACRHRRRSDKCWRHCRRSPPLRLLRHSLTCPPFPLPGRAALPGRGPLPPARRPGRGSEHARGTAASCARRSGRRRSTVPARLSAPIAGGCSMSGELQRSQRRGLSLQLGSPLPVTSADRLYRRLRQRGVLLDEIRIRLGELPRDGWKARLRVHRPLNRVNPSQEGRDLSCGPCEHGRLMRDVRRRVLRPPLAALLRRRHNLPLVGRSRGQLLCGAASGLLAVRENREARRWHDEGEHA